MKTKYFTLITTILLFAFSAQSQEKQSATIQQKQVSENACVQNTEIEFKKIFDGFMAQLRKIELDLCKKVSQDYSFRIAM